MGIKRRRTPARRSHKLRVERQLGEAVGALRDIAEGVACDIDVDCGCREVAQAALEVIGERWKE